MPRTRRSGTYSLDFASQGVYCYEVPILNGPNKKHTVEEVTSSHIHQLFSKEGVSLEGYIREGNTLDRYTGTRASIFRAML